MTLPTAPVQPVPPYSPEAGVRPITMNATVRAYLARVFGFPNQYSIGDVQLPPEVHPVVLAEQWAERYRRLPFGSSALGAAALGGGTTYPITGLYCPADRVAPAGFWVHNVSTTTAFTYFWEIARAASYGLPNAPVGTGTLTDILNLQARGDQTVSSPIRPLLKTRGFTAHPTAAELTAANRIILGGVTVGAGQSAFVPLDGPVIYAGEVFYVRCGTIDTRVDASVDFEENPYAVDGE